MSKTKLLNPRADLYPVPVSLISCQDQDTTNIITISWTGILCSHPPIVYISVRPSRKSFQLLSKNKRFCINIPSSDMLECVKTCGFTSGFDVDKASLCGFEMVSLIEGYPDAIAQCKHHLLCDIVSVLDLGSHTAFIAEVKHEFIDNNCLMPNQSIDYSAINPIAYCRKDFYMIAESSKMH